MEKTLELSSVVLAATLSLYFKLNALKATGYRIMMIHVIFIINIICTLYCHWNAAIDDVISLLSVDQESTKSYS